MQYFRRKQEAAMTYPGHRLPTEELFELQLALPDQWLTERARRLVGFPERFARLEAGLRLMIDVEGVEEWSRRFHRAPLPILTCCPTSTRSSFSMATSDGQDRDGGGGCQRSRRRHRQAGHPLKLSTRVRGEGFVGQMSALISQAFATVAKEAGKARTAYLLVDEGDSITSSRSTREIHHEDKVQ